MSTRADTSGHGQPPIGGNQVPGRLIAGAGLAAATVPGDPGAPACLQALNAALAEARRAPAGGWG